MKRVAYERPFIPVMTDDREDTGQQDHPDARVGGLPTDAVLMPPAAQQPADGQPGEAALPPMPFPGALGFQQMPVMLAAGHMPGTVTSQLVRGGAGAAITASMSALIAALTGNDFSNIRALLMAVGAGPIYIPPVGNEPALLYAVRLGQLELVEALLNAKALASIKDNRDEGDALILAAGLGHVPIIRRLLAQPGSDPDFLNVYGDSALIVAAGHGTSAAVHWLLEGDARVNLGNGEDGWTALAVAAEQGRVDIVDRLLAHPATEPDALNSDGNSALVLAAGNRNLDVVRCLLGNGARLNLLNDRDGTTALMHAARKGDVNIVQCLLAWPGIKYDLLDARGHSALAYAVRKRHLDVVSCLLGAGAAIGSPANQGNRCKSALDLLIQRRQLPLIEVFIRHGKLPETVIAAFIAEPTLFAVAVADLCAEQTATVFELPGLEQAPAFFNELIASLAMDRTGRCMLDWLRGKSMRAACAQQVLAALTGTHSPLRACGVALPRKMSYCLGALSSLDRLGAAGAVLEQYRSSGLSVAATGRLASTASMQLAGLNELAVQVLARNGAALMDKLVEMCVASTTMAFQVDVARLTGCLVDEGLLAPIALAIAESWTAAVEAVQHQKFAMPAGSTVREAGASMRAHCIAQAPAFFATNIRRQLAVHAVLLQLNALMNDGNDEGIHAQFQVQCDQLRQFCEQLLAQETSQAN